MWIIPVAEVVGKSAVEALSGSGVNVSRLVPDDDLRSVPSEASTMRLRALLYAPTTFLHRSHLSVVLLF